MANILDFEVSDYIINRVAVIPLGLDPLEDSENLEVRFINAGSADYIFLSFEAGDNRPIKVDSFIISCLSQCSLEISLTSPLNITKLELKNVVLLNKSDISAEILNIESSIPITTSIPDITNEGQIKILPSDDYRSVRNLLKSVNIIPGSGEYVYDTEIKYCIKGGGACSAYSQDNNGSRPINANNPAGIADALYNLATLKAECSNVEWVSPVVSWFGVSKYSANLITEYDVSNVKITPLVENKEEKISEKWQVAGYTRANTGLVSKDAKGRPNYGGTVSDASVVRYIEELKSSGFKVMFYPFVMLDFPGKPWRGYLTAANQEDIHEFFTKPDGYNEFILHYANLLKGKVDAFVIGSEFKSLTQTINTDHEYPNPERYPAVVELINLAKLVRNVLGPSVTLTYGADWSEYHHDMQGYYHLDALWASEYIDVVGIDAYFPITDKEKGDITTKDLKNGWKSGELYNYYYEGTKKAPLSPEWAVKNVEYWWSNEHWSHSKKSLWEPKMKPIWFTEFGYPSIHMSTNQPNVFWNPDSVDGGKPKYSSGNIDYEVQMRAIRAALEFWQGKEDIVQRMFLWAWDARPYPTFPKNLNLWSDGELWSRGHWINGKIVPESKTSITDGFKVNDLYVYAEKVTLEGAKSERSARLIVANELFLDTDISGSMFGIKSRILNIKPAIHIYLDNKLYIESQSEIVFQGKLGAEERSWRDGKTSYSTYDEYIKPFIILAGKLEVKAPELSLESGKISVKEVDFKLDDLRLISVPTNHRYHEHFQGKKHKITRKCRVSDKYISYQEVVTTDLKSEELTVKVENLFYIKAAQIQTEFFTGYAKNYEFIPLKLERIDHFKAKERNWGGFLPSTKVTERGTQEYYYGAIISIAGQGYAFAEDSIVFLASYLIGGQISLEAKKVSYNAAIGHTYEFLSVKKKGIRFFANFGGGEFVFGVEAFRSLNTRETYSEEINYAGVIAETLKVEAEVIERHGGIIAGQEVVLNVGSMLDRSPELQFYYVSNSERQSAGLKVGFQESFSNAIQSGKDLFNNVGDGNPALISAMNFVSNSRAFIKHLTEIASGNAIRGGVWAYGKISANTERITGTQQLANPISAEKLIINSNDWSMQGLEGSGRDWQVNVEQIDAKSSFDTNSVKVRNTAVNGEVQIAPVVSASLGFNRQGVGITETKYHANRVSLTGSLNIVSEKVEGLIRLEAEEVNAIVSILKLVTQQDTIYESNHNIGINVGTSSGGFHVQKEKANSQITSDGRSGFMGHNLLHVNSEQLIYLEGAYLSSSEEGTLNVRSNLIEAVDLTDKIKGWAAGFGISASSEGESHRRVAGQTNLNRNVKAAISEGVVVVGDKEIHDTITELGISREAEIQRWEGKRWRLDVTTTSLDDEAIRKATNGGLRGILDRIGGNIIDASQHLYTSIVPEAPETEDSSSDSGRSRDRPIPSSSKATRTSESEAASSTCENEQEHHTDDIRLSESEIEEKKSALLDKYRGKMRVAIEKKYGEEYPEFLRELDQLYIVGKLSFEGYLLKAEIGLRNEYTEVFKGAHKIVSFIGKNIANGVTAVDGELSGNAIYENLKSNAKSAANGVTAVGSEISGNAIYKNLKSNVKGAINALAKGKAEYSELVQDIAEGIIWTVGGGMVVKGAGQASRGFAKATDTVKSTLSKASTAATVVSETAAAAGEVGVTGIAAKTADGIAKNAAKLASGGAKVPKAVKSTIGKSYLPTTATTTEASAAREVGTASGVKFADDLIKPEVGGAAAEIATSKIKFDFDSIKARFSSLDDAVIKSNIAEGMDFIEYVQKTDILEDINWLSKTEKNNLFFKLQDQIMHPKPRIIAKGSEFKVVQRYVENRGGALSDYAKMSSYEYTIKKGYTFEVHWVENIKTGERFDFKLKHQEFRK